MQRLERLSASPEAAWYALRGDYEGRIERYLVSTAPSRAICNRSELLGVEFNLHLHDAMVYALRHAPFRALVEGHPEERVCVVNFLRGGLNFELRRALHGAYGFNRHSSAFMSSQRERVDGRWRVREDMYRKLEIPKDAVLVAGDVVATGVTLDNGFQVIADHLRTIASPPRAVVFFTIGCHKAEKVLERLDERLRSEFPTYERTILVYVEGKFRLVDSKTPLTIGIQGTDLVRWGALLAPELELSQFESPAYPLERCAIYDAGSRAFDIPTYVADVREYWEQVAELATRGFSIAGLFRERWPEGVYGDRAAFLARKRGEWAGVDDALLEELHAAWTARFTGEGAAALETPESLAALARERLATLDVIIAPESGGEG